MAALYPEFDIFFKKKKAGTNILHKKGKTNVTPYDIVDEIETKVKAEDTIKIGDRIFTAEENILTQNGENYGKIFVLTDDTEHYRYMDELQKQRDIADRANEAKSKFLASMSHEIRTPINAVLGLDEMILRETKEKETRAYAGDIMSAGRTLLSLVNDILDLSKVEEGKMEIIPVEYDLKSLINDLLNMIRSRAEKKGLELIVNVSLTTLLDKRFESFMQKTAIDYKLRSGKVCIRITGDELTDEMKERLDRIKGYGYLYTVAASDRPGE